MKKRIASLMVMASLVAAGSPIWADSVNATGNDNNPVTHPVNAYNNHEVKEDMKDSQENSQKAAEAKETYKQAKANYQKSLKDNGVDSAVTQDAKKRMVAAHKDVNKYSNKTAKANKELRKDEISSHQ